MEPNKEQENNNNNNNKTGDDNNAPQNRQRQRHGRGGRGGGRGRGRGRGGEKGRGTTVTAAANEIPIAVQQEQHSPAADIVAVGSQEEATITKNQNQPVGRGKNSKKKRNGKHKAQDKLQQDDNPGQAEQEEQQNVPPETTKQQKSRRRGNKKKKGTDTTKEHPESTEERKTEANQNGDNNSSSNHRNRGKNKKRNNNNNDSNSKQPQQYPPHWSYEECMKLYVAKDPTIIRGKMRVLPTKDGMGFCTCDRGSQKRDVILESALERNRALNGDTVFVQLLVSLEDEDEQDVNVVDHKQMEHLQIDDSDDNDNGGTAEERDDEEQFKAQQQQQEEMWQDDPLQNELWAPVVPIKRIKTISEAVPAADETAESLVPQRKGRVIHVCPPPLSKDDVPKGTKPKKVISGTIKMLQSGTCLFTPNDRLLPQFKCDSDFSAKFRKNKHETSKDNADDDSSSDLYKAEYIYHSWKENHSWPPCINVTRLGDACSIEDQIQALLMENQVNHGEFSPQVLKNVEDAVQSGVYLRNDVDDDAGSTELGWRPTAEMYKGRRDYRSERIFTIDPTTAKDLDDALHIKQLPDGRIEIGVHIADVSAFVTPGSDVDMEAQMRATTVYLVDRTVPMLPRPLCEVACSLNENVERLAFSCVWKMNPDGTLGNSKGKGKDEASQDVWYGRTVIKSCARLDYATAQNIIEKKVANGEKESDLDDQLWPKSRRPTGGHTIEQVAADVRLMHQVAMARRRLRFSNGALALHGVKLTFQLDEDGETPLACAPYPIKDSNRLVEEYMLLANYLVAQRLITHARGRAVLRRHPDPIPQGLEKVGEVAKSMFNFAVDTSSSASLHDSLVRLGAQCDDEIILQCVTQMLTTPMQNADYFAAGAFEPELWRHFALNIPYYTHFTSPIRRYADVLVHRLLQATIDGPEAVDSFPADSEELHHICEHCNEKRLASKMAQERCDVVFLALYLRKNPMRSQLGVVMSLGNKAITVYVPSIGISAMLFLEEHKEWLDYTSVGEDSARRLTVKRKAGCRSSEGRGNWSQLEVKVFSKIHVSCLYKCKPRVDVKLELEGPAR